MKRIFSLALSALLALAITGCTGTSPQDSAKPALTPQERTDLYQTAIENARNEELNEAYPPLTTPDANLAGIVFEMLGITSDDLTSYAIAISPMNIHAYGVAVVLPAEGREETVKAGLQGFIGLQQSNFETYLPEQYAITKNAKLEELDDGTLILVMCEDQDTVLEAIQSSLTAAI